MSMKNSGKDLCHFNRWGVLGVWVKVNIMVSRKRRRKFIRIKRGYK